MPNFISEDTIEQAIMKRLQQQFGFELLNCYTSDAADLNDRSGRSDKREVIFAERLKESAKRLNTGIAIETKVGSFNAPWEFFFKWLRVENEKEKVDQEQIKREGTSVEAAIIGLCAPDRLLDYIEKMTKAEDQKVKLAAKTLLHRLLEEQPKVLVQDWFKDTQSQFRVRDAVEQVLHKQLPDSYNRVLFKNKCDAVFETMLNYAAQGQKWAA